MPGSKNRRSTIARKLRHYTQRYRKRNTTPSDESSTSAKRNASGSRSSTRGTRNFSKSKSSKSSNDCISWSFNTIQQIKHGQAMTKIFPTILMVMQFAASIPYAIEGNARMAVYWIAAGILTLALTYL